MAGPMRSRFVHALTLVAPLLGVTVGAPQPVSAQSDAGDPACAYAPIDIDRYGGASFANPPVIRSHDGTLTATLVIGYADNVIAGCKVHLRSYNGRLVGPTLRARPGDTLNIRFVNDLPDNPTHMPVDPNTPHNFNTTNLHTHGLHVSPAGNSDNVLLHVQPGTRFDYEIKIPADHPAGTFWYHAHVHGSTALQVSSGMAGALIIEGGLDDVPAIRDAEEKILVFEQIAYDTNGEIEDYAVFGPGKWAASHRQTLINGQLVPVIRMRPGEVQRWRMIHGGVRETLSPVLKDTGRAPADLRLTGFGAEQLAALPRAAPFHEIAVDGLALGSIDRWDVVELEPGYRSDVLVKAPLTDRAVTLTLNDGVLPTDKTLLGEPEPERVLARIIVSGKPLDMPLPTSGEVAGLAPFKPVTDAELDGERQRVAFNIARRVCPPGEVCRPCQDNEPNCALRFMVNERPYATDHVRILRLNTAAEWTLSSDAASHPFHIHVNPFQVTRVGPDGLDEIVWRDTLFVRSGEAPVKIRTRYERYVGRFVLHCHILDHEDQGMMELVEIVN